MISGHRYSRNLGIKRLSEGPPRRFSAFRRRHRLRATFAAMFSAKSPPHKANSWWILLRKLHRQTAFALVYRIETTVGTACRRCHRRLHRLPARSWSPIRAHSGALHPLVSCAQGGEAVGIGPRRSSPGGASCRETRDKDAPSPLHLEDESIHKMCLHPPPHPQQADGSRAHGLTRPPSTCSSAPHGSVVPPSLMGTRASSGACGEKKSRPANALKSAEDR